MTYSVPFSTKRQFNNIPLEYIVKKFYELGFFAQYNTGLDNYSCSCPLCREGDTGIGRIKRCFYLPDRDIIYCHRCGASMKPFNWIKAVSGRSYEDIWEEIESGEYDFIDLSSNSQLSRHDYNEFKDSISEFKVDSLPKEYINLNDKMQYEFYKNNPMVQRVVSYIKKRRLDTAINSPTSWMTTIADPIHYGRLVIPFYNLKNEIEFYQSRDVTEKSSIRYLSKIKGNKTVFNINKIDNNLDNYFIFEGPFDSCFVRNGVAIGGINMGKNIFNNFQEIQLNNIDMDRIWVLDSQYLDEVSYKKTEILLQQGEKVFLYPEKLGNNFKDFNEICMARKIDEIPQEFILQNTISGFSGILKFSQIKIKPKK